MKNVINKYKKLQKAGVQVKFQNLYDLAWEYYGSDYEKFFEYSKQALAIAEKNNNREQIAIGYKMFGIYYDLTSNLPKSFQYTLKSLNMFKQMKDELNYAKLNYNLAKLYVRRNEYKKALEYYIIALEIFEKKKDMLSLAVCLNGIGTLYWDFRENDKALNHFQRAIKIHKELNSERDLDVLHLNLGNVYFQKEKYREALASYQKGIEYCLKKHTWDTLASIYLLMSEIYEKLGSSEKSSFYLQEVQKINEKIHNKFLISEIAMTSYHYYYKHGNFSKAEETLLENADFCRKNDFQDKLLNTYYQLREFYKSKSDYKKALHYSELFLDVKLTLLNRENIRNLEELKLKYEIHEIERKAKEERKEREELERLNSIKDKLFSIIAHDLRSPFATLTSFISLMKKNIENYSKEEIKELVNDLDKIMSGVKELLENLLSWSRMPTGSISNVPQLIVFHKVIDKILNLKKLSIEEKNLEIIKDFREDEIFANEFLLQTILRNLIDNAIKFSYPNGQIHIQFYKEKANFIIEIADEGVGIEEKNISKIFKIGEGFSKRGTKNEKGSGIGLLICKDFVEMQDGKISLKSESGKGSTFKIILPDKKIQGNRKKLET